MIDFVIGDRVKKSDADNPNSIPAYRDLRGTVVEVGTFGIKVKWDCDREPEFGFRTRATVTKVI